MNALLDVGGEALRAKSIWEQSNRVIRGVPSQGTPCCSPPDFRLQIMRTSVLKRKIQSSVISCLERFCVLGYHE